MLKRVAERSELREGPQGIEDVLRAIFRQAHQEGGIPLTGRDLARLVRLPVPVVTAVRRELEREGVVEPGPHIRLSEAALAAMHLWGWASEPQAKASNLCKTCAGTGIVTPGKDWQSVLSVLRKHFEQNPRVDVTLDQSHCTPETNVRRVALMQEYGALEGKDVLVLGDDDSLSAGIALAGKQLSGSGRLARRVIAVDTDERILRHLRDIAVQESVIIGLIRHDLRKPLPDELLGQFDTVATDPPYTLEGLELFLSRAIEAARPDTGRIFLSFGHRPPDELLQVQAAIARMGLVIEGLIPGFNSYVGAGVLAGASDMYRLAVTPGAKPSLQGEHTGPLYTGQTRPTLRMYACAECGAQVAVGGEGGGTFSTIEELKSQGCPTCGASTFRLISKRRVVREGHNGNSGPEGHNGS